MADSKPLSGDDGRECARDFLRLLDPSGGRLEPSRPCKRCEAGVVFVTNERTGREVPLDTRRHPVFFVTFTPEGLAIATPIAGAYVSHFATCPHASEFSKRNRK